MKTHRTRTAVALALLALTACGDTKPTTPPAPSSSITLTAGSGTVTIAQGATADQPITIARTNFAGPVDLTAEGLPSGVTATFAPAVLTSGATASTLTLSVGATATVGTATVTVRARGTGITDAVATIPLSVIAALPGSSVALSLTDTTASGLPGDTLGTQLAITRSTGYTGAVTLSVTGAPAGMTTSFSAANPVLAASVRLALSTTPAVVPGTYTLTVRANATGISEALAVYTVVIAPLPSTSVTWRYCASGRVPVWFAYQDGLTSTWRRVTAASDGGYTFAAGQPQVGIATVTIEPGVTVTRVRWVGLSELAAAAAAECTDFPASGTKTLTGTVTGMTGSAETVNVTMGASVSGALTQASPAFSLSRVPDGPRDLIAVLTNGTSGNTLRVLLQRGLNPGTNANLGTLDLFGVTSFAPASATLTVTAPNDGAIVAQTIVTTASGTSATLTLPQLSSGVPLAYPALPAAQLIAGDLQEVRVTQAVGTALTRSASRFVRTPAAITLAMPTDAAAPTVTPITGAAYPRATLSGTLAAAFNGGISINFEQPSQGRVWELSATPAGRGGTLTAYTLAIPDLSGASGWQSAWALATGTTRIVSTFGGQTAAGANNTSVDGTERVSVGRVSSTTFP